jgi:hypothetical protein
MRHLAFFLASVVVLAESVLLLALALAVVVFG